MQLPYCHKFHNLPKPNGFSPVLFRKPQQHSLLGEIKEVSSKSKIKQRNLNSPHPIQKVEEESVFSTETVKRKLKFSPYCEKYRKLKERKTNYNLIRLNKCPKLEYCKTDEKGNDDKINDSFVVYNVQAKENCNLYRYVPQLSNCRNILHMNTHIDKKKYRKTFSKVRTASMTNKRFTAATLDYCPYFADMMVKKMSILRHIR